MKITYLTLSTSLLLWGAAACTEESVVPPEEFFVKADKDGQVWDKSGAGSYSKSSGEFNVFSPEAVTASWTGDPNRPEVLRLSFALPHGQPWSAVRALPAEWLALVGGDGVTNSYATADSTGLPSIQVTRLDTIQKIVEGRFEATLRRDKHFTQQVELMRFTKGSFRVRYQEYP